MNLTLLLISALTPIIVLICYIYIRDKHQREPVKELFKAFGLGILSVFVSLIISTPLELLGLFSNSPSTLGGCIATSFLGAAIPEELAKFFMFWLLVRNNRFFDEKMDGIVYASIVSLGFAALENVMYLATNYDSWLEVGITRALFSVPGHFFFGVLMGYYYSLVRFCPSVPKSYRWLVLVAPILAHGLFDTILFSTSVAPGIGLILMIVFLVFCNSLRKRASHSIKSHLMADAVTESSERDVIL